MTERSSRVGVLVFPPWGFILAGGPTTQGQSEQFQGCATSAGCTIVGSGCCCDRVAIQFSKVKKFQAQQPSSSKSGGCRCACMPRPPECAVCLEGKCPLRRRPTAVPASRPVFRGHWKRSLTYASFMGSTHRLGVLLVLAIPLVFGGSGCGSKADIDSCAETCPDGTVCRGTTCVDECGGAQCSPEEACIDGACRPIVDSDGGQGGGLDSGSDAGSDDGGDSGADSGFDAGGGDGGSDAGATFHKKPYTTDAGIFDVDGTPLNIVGINVMAVWTQDAGSGLPPRWRGPGWTDYARIRDAGFNTVALWTRWYEMEPNVGDYDAGIGILDRNIRDAVDAGLKVILRPVLNGDPNGSNAPPWAKTDGGGWEDMKTNSFGYLSFVAQRYRDNPSVIMYSLPNEFRVSAWGSPQNQNEVLEFASTTIRNIRANFDPDTIWSINTASGDTSWAPGFLDAGSLTVRENVVHTFHDYYGGGADAGYDPTTGSAIGWHTWGIDGGYWGRGAGDWPNDAGYEPSEAGLLEEHFLVQLRAAQRLNIPLLVEETGIAQEAAHSEQWVQHQVAIFKKYGVGAIWWTYAKGTDLTALYPDGGFKPVVLLFASDMDAGT